MPIKNRIAEMKDEIVAWRRDIHANPELLYDLPRTSAFVAEKLRAFGCDEVTEGIAQTGVVAVIKGSRGASGRVVGLRADMDALPIHEETGLDYASKTDGKMHACGHDGHTAMLLGAAKYLAETRNFDGSVVLIFQPAEEGGHGGKVMCDEGLMDRWKINEVYAIHNAPGIPVGEISVKPGPSMAAADIFEIDVIGKGGHGARPENTIDAGLIACQIVISLQSIASRNTSPLDALVISVGCIETSSKAFNVIPQKTHLKGTVRTTSPEVRQMARQRIKDIATMTATMHGGEAVVNYIDGVPALINSSDEAGYAADAALRITGGCLDTPVVMGGEDFAFMLNERPGAMIRLGNGDSKQLHHPEYNFNDDAIPVGCSWFVEMVESRLALA
ncbi:M20 aminoacylase family protein [Arenibacterium halophilum]|uniref:Amidohydrolase n=1 Tax=Arenibacterium halophilum TaxID=2583821 RepID=A0ABY2WZI9_9RHOB|nr:M20 aminoacylase family protein [Arenibacterium halophilum]TMV08366.1 amidohydrolase [Arenibacterium halophilum]